MSQQRKPWGTKDIQGWMEEKTVIGFVQLSWYFIYWIWVLTTSSYQRRRKRSSSCQTFLRNSITHQCLLFRCKTSSSRAILPRNSRAVLWRNPARKPCWMVALRSYLSSGGLISAVVQRQSGPGPNSTGQGPCRGGRGAEGAKKCSDQACNDRQTQKNPRWMDSLLGEHLHKN